MKTQTEIKNKIGELEWALSRNNLSIQLKELFTENLQTYIVKLREIQLKELGI